MNCHNCFDLPSLTRIECLSDCNKIHFRMYSVILESGLFSIVSNLDIPNLAYENIDYGYNEFHYTENVVAKSILFLLISPCRCSWPR